MKARGLDNLRINLDPANLLLYGKGNPMDAVDVFGQYVVSMHVKDGDYPTDGNNLGCEYKVGTGRVNFDYILRKLRTFNYQGPLTIEREISGEQQNKDIIDTIQYLQNIESLSISFLQLLHIIKISFLENSYIFSLNNRFLYFLRFRTTI